MKVPDTRYRPVGSHLALDGREGLDAVRRPLCTNGFHHLILVVSARTTESGDYM